MSFKPNRNRLLDTLSNGSLLFRGNLPESSNVFVINDVLNSMEIQAKKSNTNFDKKAAFYDFTLISELIEREAYNIEDNFFEQHPNIGKLLHEDIDGIALRTVIFGPKVLGNAMLNVVRKVRATLEDNKGINLYLHCAGGLDRTGIISAGYGLLYQGFSADDAKNVNTAVGLPRNPSFSATIAIEAMVDVLNK